MQTYQEYLETMDAYNFHPLDQQTWEQRQIEQHGTFKPTPKLTTITRQHATIGLTLLVPAFNHWLDLQVETFLKEHPELTLDTLGSSTILVDWVKKTYPLTKETA